MNQDGNFTIIYSKLLQFDNKDCFNGNNIKSNEKCILRNGVNIVLNIHL